MLLPLHVVTSPLSLFSSPYPCSSPSYLVLYRLSSGQSNCGEHHLSKSSKTFLFDFSVCMRRSFAPYILHETIDAEAFVPTTVIA